MFTTLPNETVKNYVATDLVCTLSSEFTVKDAAVAFIDYQCSALFVVNDKQEVIGIVTERDLVKQFAHENHQNTKLIDICSKNLTTITKDTNLQKALDIMIESNIRHLPIVENRKIVGLISLGKIYHTLRSRMHQEVSEMKAFLFQDRYGA